MAFIMKDNAISILSTRPLDDALIERAAYKNITLETLDFIDIKKLVTPEVKRHIELLSAQKQTVVFTSMNAVEIVVSCLPVRNQMPDWKIYCLGGATFTLVKKFWPYSSVAYTAKSAAEVAGQITRDNLTEVIFFCGNKRREELPEILSQNNITVNELVVYETVETPVKVIKNYSAILFFSPSAVQSFFTSNHIPENTILFAIGNTTAAAIKQFCGNEIIVSEFPAKDRLVDKAISYFSEI